jgi:serine/threonine protein kinase
MNEAEAAFPFPFSSFVLRPSSFILSPALVIIKGRPPWWNIHMSSLTLEQFTRNLSESGLLTVAEVAMFLDRYAPHSRPRDGMALARELVHANRLTKYQATVICQGRGKSLVFDEYIVWDKIGQGGMGVVLKAQHRRMRRLVAIKMLPKAMLGNAESVRRFYHEVEAAARLSHPNIVTAYDAREQDNVHCLIMEYVDGHSLAVILKQYGPLPLHQAVKCTLQAARGLEYAHSQGVVHRDIKPGNLLIDKHGVVKILDMGLALIQREAETSDADRLTQSGQVMGTCDYMAPEQAQDPRRADHRSDIYGLGCTLFRLLTGRPPFTGETIVQVLLAHRETPIPSLTAARPDVPPQLDGIFRKMLAKRPADRYQSMAEVIADLEAVVSQSQPAAKAAAKPSSDSDFRALLRSLGSLATFRPARTATAPEGGSASMSSRSEIASVSDLSRADRRRMLLIGLAGGLGATLVAGLFWLVWGGRQSSSAPVSAGSVSASAAGGDVSAQSTSPAGPGVETAPPVRSATSSDAAARTSPGKMAENILDQSHAAAPRDSSGASPPGGTAAHKRSLVEMATEISGDKTPGSSGPNDSQGKAHGKSAQ